jgi:hypothetical protein
MNAELCWRSLEDQPAVVGIDVGQRQDIPEERSSCCGVVRVDDEMSTDDHRATIL